MNTVQTESAHELQPADWRGTRNLRRYLIPALIAAVVGALLLELPGLAERIRLILASTSPTVTVDADAAVHLPPLTVPFSEFASPQAKATFLDIKKFYGGRFASASTEEQRRMLNAHLQPALERTKSLYPANSVATTIAGVSTDVITPSAGISARNRNRVLINLHGGGFAMGARILGALESIPVASLGRIKVVTVDYRQGPEYRFPAASEDVAAVYKELLEDYKPANIGIYGCSAGGVLTAETIAWIAKANLPAPGAIGIFCASAAGWHGGDSSTFGPALLGFAPPAKGSLPHFSVSNAEYFHDADMDDPLVQPLRSAAVLAKFPPTLIITSTRDYALSPAVYTHELLVKLGVDAELHVWEGMTHGFFTTDPNLPESREVWDVVTRFFDKHLGSE